MIGKRMDVNVRTASTNRDEKHKNKKIKKKKKKEERKKKVALAGTRTRIDRVAGDHSTLRPPVPELKAIFQVIAQELQKK